MPPPSRPKATETVVGRSTRAIVLENDLVSATVLVDQGADIHTLVYKPRGVDVLWKPPRPPREHGVGPPVQGDSETLWHHYYRGGWNTIFPNFGPAVVHRGAPLDFHGEAARSPWELEGVESTEEGVRVTMVVRLIKSPFHVRREMSLEAGRPVLSIRETVTHDGVEPMECMWGHHPTFGPPLLSPGTVIDTGARSIQSDDGAEVPDMDLAPGETWAWPDARDRQGAPVDMSRVPEPGSGLSRVVYLKDFAEGWYAITNPALGWGAGLVWDAGLFPYACFWQETGGERGHPFFGKAYVTAIEPFSSYPGIGLTRVMETTATHLTLEPGESRTVELKAVFYDGTERVSRIDPSGSVERR
jgi:hypothetical protein